MIWPLRSALVVLAKTRSCWLIGVLGARLDRDRDGLFVFFVCIILFCVAAAVYLLADLLVAAAPVVMLASRVTIAGPEGGL